MDESEQLRRVVRQPTRQKPRNTAARLGEVVKQLMESQVSPRQAMFGTIAKVWGELLPAELRRHCEVTDISGGRLKVLVDSPSYMYELQLCSSELLEELQRRCSAARIKKIKFAVG